MHCFNAAKKELIGIIRGEIKLPQTNASANKPNIVSILDKAPTKMRDVTEKLVSMLNTTTPVLTTTIKQDLDKAMKCKITSKEYDQCVGFFVAIT